MSLSNRVRDSLLSALGSVEARNELVIAVDAAGGSSITALTGDVSASGSGSIAATVNSVGGSSASSINAAVLLANSAVSTNTPSTIVKRDGSGNFSAGTITASLTGHASLDLALSGGTMSGAIAMGSNKITGLGTPTVDGDAATKAYVDSASSGTILTFLSTAVGAGAADAAVTVTGLLATDTILAITQQIRGATTAAFIGWTSVVDDGFTGHWSADPGGTAQLLVAVKR